MNDNARIVHKFRYHGKTFSAGELTVGLYLMYAVDPYYTIDYILTEYNDEKPKLSQAQYKRFLRILFGVKKLTLREVVSRITSPGKFERRIDRAKQHLEDFHIRVAFVSKNTNLDVLNLPLRLFRKLLDDMGVITGKDQYDPNRNKRTLDSNKLREEMGSKNHL